ncbi:MAG TPA: cytochrome c3 family protein, partial [Gemmataceae bacterium]|nr:cytochrome c3 family protein [Gemmataceae bacterium]
LPRYLPSRIPQVWLSHSRFSHARHRMLRCTECHDAANSSMAKDVLLPKIESCRQCHNSQIGARADCAECHRYHQRSPDVLKGQRTISDSVHKP